MPRTIGIIVDGEGDYKSVRARFPNKRTGPTVHVVVTTGPRGHTVSPQQLVSGARKQVAILESWGCTAIILLFDFEERAERYTDFLINMNTEVERGGFGVPVLIASPNRMIENWYLADIVELSRRKSFLRDNLSQKKYEGTDGKTALKKLFKSGTMYSETKHGPSLFSSIRITVAKVNSASFAHFLELMRVA